MSPSEERINAAEEAYTKAVQNTTADYCLLRERERKEYAKINGTISGWSGGPEKPDYTRIGITAAIAAADATREVTDELAIEAFEAFFNREYDVDNGWAREQVLKFEYVLKRLFRFNA